MVLISIAGESEYYDVWREGYSAIMKYSRGPEGFWVSKCIKQWGFSIRLSMAV
jgi:hypothetical protein